MGSLIGIMLLFPRFVKRIVLLTKGVEIRSTTIVSFGLTHISQKEKTSMM